MRLPGIVVGLERQQWNAQPLACAAGTFGQYGSLCEKVSGFYAMTKARRHRFLDRRQKTQP
jgi:hypothetical protein